MTDARQAEREQQARETYWLIAFDDREVPNLVFTDEAAARKSFESHSQAWSCRLFCEASLLKSRESAALEEVEAEINRRVNAMNDDADGDNECRPQDLCLWLRRKIKERRS